MPWLEQWISKFDPNQAPITALVMLIFVCAILFVWKKVWPWFVEDYWPKHIALIQDKQRAHLEMEKERTNIWASIRDAMVELRVMNAQTLLVMQQQGVDLKTLVGQQANMPTLLDLVRTNTVADVLREIKGKQA